MPDQKRITQEMIDYIREANDLLNDFKYIMKRISPYIIFEAFRMNTPIKYFFDVVSSEIIFQLCMRELASSNIEASNLGTIAQEAIEKVQSIARQIGMFSLFNESKPTSGSMTVENKQSSRCHITYSKL